MRYLNVYIYLHIRQIIHHTNKAMHILRMYNRKYKTKKRYLQIYSIFFRKKYIIEQRERIIFDYNKKNLYFC